MSDSFIAVQGTSQKIDTRSVTTGVGTVERQVGAIGDGVTGSAVARVGPGISSEALRVVPAADFNQQTQGASVFHLASAASTNVTVIKGSPGKVVGVWVTSGVNSFRKLAFYDSAVAPTPGTTPIKFAVGVPANGTAFISLPPEGVNFANGIAIATVTGLGDGSAAAVGANDMLIGVAYV